ncbi:MAG: acyl-CoA dehydrogenase family protein [Betaproteobacteria bacterium]
MFLDALDRILSDHAGSSVVRQLETQDGCSTGLWQAVAQAGFLDLLRGQDEGGADLPPRELFALLECVGRYGLPLPLAQTIMARGLLPAGLNLPMDAMITLATQLARGADGRLQCSSVPGGWVASHVIAREGPRWLLLDARQAQRESVSDPRSLMAHLTWTDAQVLHEDSEGGPALSACAGALTAALISGALARVLDMSLAHCNARVQFGKPIGRFQAIQQQISVMAEHVLAGSLAAESAFRYDGAAPALLPAAVAKSRASEAAGLVASGAHAVHGAMGMTDEFELSIMTRRLLQWRLQYGAEQYWNVLIGADVLAGELTLVDFVRML